MTPDLRQRRVFTRLSIAAGNAVQIAGLIVGCLFLLAAARAGVRPVAVAEALAGLLLIYLSCHAIAHWFVGRVLGIRFRFYTLGSAADAQSWPVGLRWLMRHAPFFGVQTDKASMEPARPLAKAALWSAGVTSSAVLPNAGSLLGVSVEHTLWQGDVRVHADLEHRHCARQLLSTHRRLFQSADCLEVRDAPVCRFTSILISRSL